MTSKERIDKIQARLRALGVKEHCYGIKTKTRIKVEVMVSGRLQVFTIDSKITPYSLDYELDRIERTIKRETKTDQVRDLEELTS